MNFQNFMFLLSCCFDHSHWLPPSEFATSRPDTAQSRQSLDLELNTRVARTDAARDIVLHSFRHSYWTIDSFFLEFIENLIFVGHFMLSNIWGLLNIRFGLYGDFYLGYLIFVAVIFWEKSLDFELNWESKEEAWETFLWVRK